MFINIKNKFKFFKLSILTICFLGNPLFVYADYDKAIEYYNQKDYKKSIVAFRNFISSETSNENKKKDAMYNLAVIYDFGLGVPSDKIKALKWYRKASKKNHKIAQFNLAWIYYNGENVEKNNFEAFRYYSLSAEQGYNKAQFNLASLYLSGKGTLKDYVGAYKWFKISSLNGISESELYLSKIEKKIHPEELSEANKQVESWLNGYKNKME